MTTLASISSLLLLVITVGCLPRAVSADVYLSAQPSRKDIYEAAWHYSASLKDNPGARLAIAPHHLLAAEYTARAYRHLTSDCRRVLVVSPDHFSGRYDFSSSAMDWQTPYGILAHDNEADQQLTVKLPVRDVGMSLGREHGLTSQAAFVKKRWPQASWWPLMVRPVLNKEQQEKFNLFLAQYLTLDGSCAVLSSDFSHNVTANQAEKETRLSLQAIRQNKHSLARNDCSSGLQAFIYYAQKNALSFRLSALSHSRLLAPRQKDGQVTSYLAGVFSDTIDHPLRMLFFGDLMLDRGVKERIDKSGMRWLFDGLEKSSLLPGSYDLISANLEGAVTVDGKHYPPSNKYDFAMRPADVSAILDYGFLHFSLANNHSGDQGEKGWQETKVYLDDKGFSYAGCGNLRLGDCTNRVMYIGGRKVSMVSVSQVYGTLDQGKLSKYIADLRKSNDWIIVNLHWGQEYSNRSNRGQQKLARALIDAGADLIIGHHPHVVQGIETYKGRPIFYSLGNFIFDQGWSTATREELALDISLGFDEIGVRLVPMWADRIRPMLLSGTKKDDFFRRLSQYSGPSQQIEEYMTWSINK